MMHTYLYINDASATKKATHWIHAVLPPDRRTHWSPEGSLLSTLYSRKLRDAGVRRQGPRM